MGDDADTAKEQGELSVDFVDVLEENEFTVARVMFRTNKYYIHPNDFSDLLNYLNMLPNDSEQAKKYLWEFARKVPLKKGGKS